jgi:hypothetical protein
VDGFYQTENKRNSVMSNSLLGELLIEGTLISLAGSIHCIFNDFISGNIQMKKFAFAAVLSVLALTGCKTAEQALMESGAKQLNAAEITSNLGDKTMNVTLADGIKAVSYFNPNGKAYAKNRNGSSDGTWKVNAQDQLCINWEKWGAKCVKVYASGAEFKEVDGAGNLYLTVNTIRPGNPEKF